MVVSQMQKHGIVCILNVIIIKNIILYKKKNKRNNNFFKKGRQAVKATNISVAHRQKRVNGNGMCGQGFR